ncbi:hypothetical protein [Azospirillum argentinense]
MKRLWKLVEYSIGSWVVAIGVDLGSWSLGFGFDLRPAYFWVEVGPLYCDFCHDEPWPLNPDEIPNWNLRVSRWVAGRLEARLQIDWNIWRLGICMADACDWGVYVGSLNVQFEYNKRYADDR